YVLTRDCDRRATARARVAGDDNARFEAASAIARACKADLRTNFRGGLPAAAMLAHRHSCVPAMPGHCSSCMRIRLFLRASAAVDPGDVYGAVVRNGHVVERVRRGCGTRVVVHVNGRLERATAVCRACQS